MAKILSHALFAAIALMIAMTAGAPADPIIKVGVPPAEAGAFGNLLQKDLKDSPGCGDLDGFGCGPTAAINSFVYLQNTYPKTYGKKLVPELDRTKPENDLNADKKVDGYDDMIAATRLLAENYMRTCCDRTTLRNLFYSGKRDYIEDRAPGVTDYAAMDDPSNDIRDPGGSFPADTPDLVRRPPSAAFLIDGLREGQDIEVLVFFVNSKGMLVGHYVTVTGLEWSDDDRDGAFDRGEAAKIHLFDPVQGAVTRDFSEHEDGHVFWIGSTGLQIDIRFAVDESPKFRKSDPIPAPAHTWPLLALLVAFLALRHRFRRPS